MSGRLPLALMRIDPRALRNLCAKFHLLEVCRRGRHGPSFLLDIKYALPMESAAPRNIGIIKLLDSQSIFPG